MIFPFALGFDGRMFLSLPLDISLFFRYNKNHSNIAIPDQERSMKSHRFLEQIKRPHGFFLFLVYLLTLTSAVASVLLIVYASENESLKIPSYVVFGVAALSLGYTVYTFVVYLPQWKRRFCRQTAVACVFRPYSAQLFV